MSHHKPQYQAYRLFTFRLDGQPRTKTIDHLPGLGTSLQTLQLQRRFLAWIEREAPGCLAAARVTDISYSDDVREINDSVEIGSAPTAA